MIYFMQPTAGGAIKIGFTNNLEGRHRELERYYDCELSILATMDGGRAEEAEIHRRFRRHRFGQTEQFRPAPEIMEFIGRPLLADPNHADVKALGGSRTLVFHLTKESHRLLRIQAAEEGVSMSALAKRLLVSLVNKDANQKGFA